MSDKTSSIEVPPGCLAILYEDENFQGWTTLYPAGVYKGRAFLEQGARNDSASSLVVADAGATVQWVTQWTMTDSQLTNMYPAIAPLGASEPAGKPAVWHGVRCHVSGMNPIVGPRFKKLGKNYDLCEAEFAKLDDEAKAAFIRMDLPTMFGEGEMLAHRGY